MADVTARSGERNVVEMNLEMINAQYSLRIVNNVQKSAENWFYLLDGFRL